MAASKGRWHEQLAFFLRGYRSPRDLSWWDVSRTISSMIFAAVSVYFIAAAGVGIWNWTLETRELEYQYHQRAYQDRQNLAQRVASSCAIPGAPIDVVRMCLVDEVERNRTSGIPDEDLKAQQDMARWTLVMGIVAIVSVPLSMAGLIAVWLSLRQTRRAILNDREIGQAQVRAYIAVEPKQLSSITSDKLVSSSFDFRNTGQSPARNVRYVAGIVVAPYPLPDGQQDLFMAADGQIIPRLTLAPGPPNTGEAIAPGTFTPDQIKDAMGGGSTRIYMAGLIWYEDVFQVKRQTRFCFYLDQSDETAPPRERSMGLRLYNWHQAHVHNDET